MYFTFSQNNSGGSFITNDLVCHYVIIEATTAEQANNLAETHGIYFDGESDCPCCGNRWSQQWDDSDGTSEPTIYDKTPGEYQCMWTPDGEVYCRVYHADGLKQEYRAHKPTTKQIK